MKPKFRLPSLLAGIFFAVSSPFALNAATIELDLATNNPDPLTLADSGTSYTFSFSSIDIEYLIVGGGGAGGTTSSGSTTDAGGGGGAGGLLTGTTSIGGANLIVVGAGGSVNINNGGRGGQGGNSSAFDLTAIGGGGGGWASQAPADGGSGGGAGARTSADGGTAGAGTEGQGNDGGARANTQGRGAASGGGAGGAGIDNSSSFNGSNGGLNVSSSITGVATTYAAGGGGGAGNSSGATGGISATGGNGGDHQQNGSKANDNTGGGGGGGAGGGRRNGGAGGSGIIVVRYSGPQVLSGGVVSTDDPYTVHQFLDTGTNTLGFNVTVAGGISGAGDLVWDGGGTLALSGTNTYTGETSVDNGTLLFNGDSSAVTGNLTVNNTATLGGSGTFGGNVTVTANGKLAPGASIGTLTIDGNLDVSAMAGAAGQFIFELGPIATSDQIAVGGTLNIGTETLGFSDFDFTDAGGLEEGSYILITSSNLTGTLDPADLTGTISGFDAELLISDDNILLVLGEAPPVGGYTLWAETNAPTGNPDDDFDGDGVSNAVEFVLGGDKHTNDLDKLPVLGTEEGNMTFTFVRDQDSITDATVEIEVGTDLANWPAIYNVAADTTGSSAGVTVSQNDPENGLDTVTLSVTQDPDAKKFARLKVTINL